MYGLDYDYESNGMEWNSEKIKWLVPPFHSGKLTCKTGGRQIICSTEFIKTTISNFVFQTPKPTRL